MAGCRKSGTYCFRFSAGCCLAAASAAAPDLHRLLAAAHPQMRPADRNHQLASLISQLCPSAGSACALLQPAVSHSCALSHYTARRIHSCKADPDNAWTVGPADELGVSWRAERALFELLQHARRASRRSERDAPQRRVTGCKALADARGCEMVWPFQQTTGLATCCVDFSRWCLAD